MSTFERLRKLADRYGVAAGLHDLAGTWHAPDETALRHVLAALGVNTGSDAALDDALVATTRANTRAVVAPVVFFHEDTPMSLTLCVAEEMAGPFIWEIRTEAGAVFAGRDDTRTLNDDGAGGVRWAVPVALPSGYHDLDLQLEGKSRCRARLIVTPPSAFDVASSLDGGRAYGVMLQIYSIRSESNWGIGDFDDVRAAIDVFAPLGAAFVGLSPLHAGFLHDPTRCSPYSPSNRRLLNPLYLAVEALDDFRDCAEAVAWLKSAPVQARLQAVRASDLVDYTEVTALKLEALEFAFRSFKTQRVDDARHAEMAAFRETHGEMLTAHARWEAAGQDGGVRCDPDFYIYLQWQTARQLDALAMYAAKAGMPVGLYLDLAVGVTADGGEVNATGSLMAKGVSLGAPPDDFSPTGQNWALPPWNPHTLRQSAYEPFVRMLRAVMRAGGALRIDHVVGLLRQFWIPDGQHASDGAYVHFPVRDLLAIIALESHRNRCAVIGEDLGTVPDEMRALLSEHGLLSYRVLYFERYWHGDQSYKKPWDFPADALVTIATHDLPTLAGYFSAHDLKLRDAIGKLPPGTSFEQQRAHREWECGLMRRGLAEEGLGELPLSTAVHSYVARTSCKLMAVQIEDLLRLEEQVNIPDTIDEHPNWRRRMPLPVEAWADDADIKETLAAVSLARGDRSGP